MGGEQFHAFYVATNYDAAQFALYAVGTLQLPMIGHLMHSIGETIVLDGSKNYVAGNLREMARVWRRATYMLALVLMPLFFMLEVFGRDIIEIFFGAGYTASTDVFRVFIITLPLSILLGSTLLRSTGDLKQMIVAHAVSLLVTAGALMLMVDWIGIMAAAWSVVLGNLALTAIVTARILRRLQVGIRDYLEWRGILYVTIAACSCVLVGYFATSFMPQWVRVFMGPGVASLLYLSAIWFMRLVPDAERDLIMRIWSQANVVLFRARGRAEH